MRSYYRQRAPEYDDWWNGSGLFARRDRPGWHEDVAALTAALGGLPPRRTIDVACGTGFLTAHLPGEVTGVDQSEEMLAIARERVPAARYEVGDALAPAGAAMGEGAFERVFTAHFYGHLLEDQRAAFLGTVRRLAPEIVVVDSARRDRDEDWQERVLGDGTRHRVYKRWFTAPGLVAELGGGDVVHDGPWFVAVRRSSRRS